jgi:uncharacterized protein YeaO (DUF488 family)
MSDDALHSGSGPTTGADTGTLHDTYHAALQNDHVEPADDDLVLGVVREQMYGIQKYIDENWSALAPPTELLHEFKDTADEIGHNEAVEAVDFRSRYRGHLTGTAQVMKVNNIIRELEAGRDVWLVCYENTDDKFCHREVLAENIRDRQKREVAA